MFLQNENRNEGTFGCSPGTKTGTRALSHVAPERKPERGYIRQNHPFTKPPFCQPSTIAASPPLLSVKMAYRNSKTGLGGGVSQEKLASEAYRTIGGISIANRATVE